ncbi:MAG: Arylsulfatase [Bacteroidota bacterium]|jgi:arylsulfatase
MNYKFRILILSIGFSIFWGCQKVQNESRPNIIVILSDDMGYSDIGAYGGEISTPNLDSLAQNGLRFTQFYNTGRCCPTRASLLTGLYPHQTGVGYMMDDQQEVGYRGNLNNSCVTIAEALKPAGYATFMAGKWHVTPAPKLAETADKSNWPLQRGFDRYYGIINGASSFWDPNSLVRDNTQITIHSDTFYQPKGAYHLTDAITDNAIQFIREHNNSNPFFMYVAYTAAHWPLHAREGDIQNYEGKYEQGYESIRRLRLKRIKEFGLIPKESEMAPTIGNWESLENPVHEANLMETYAAMVDQMDQGIGKLVQTLKDKGQLENTMILYLQDNGGCAEDLSWMKNRVQGPRATAPSLLPIALDSVYYDQSAPPQTRDGWPVLFGGVAPGPADTYLSYNGGWANVSNTPFREFKHFVHEGGISTPLIVHWPNGIQSKNEIRHEPGHLIDIMATCLDAARAQYPKQYHKTRITPLEGKSLLPVFQNQEIQRDLIFWEHEGNRALRMNHWKIVSKGFDAPWELYNIDRDRAELHDLSATYPDTLKTMATLWEREASRTKVYPRPK